MDPFAKKAEQDNIIVDNDRKTCANAAEFIKNQIITEGSFLNSLLNMKLNGYNNALILKNEVPKNLHTYFDILEKCDGKYASGVNSIFDQTSKYLKIRNNFSCGIYRYVNDKNCSNKSGLSVQYNKDGVFEENYVPPEKESYGTYGV